MNSLYLYCSVYGLHNATMAMAFEVKVNECMYKNNTICISKKNEEFSSGDDS